jgi:peptide chain release factor 2
MPDFWDKPEVSAPVLKEKKLLETNIDRAEKLEGLRDDLEAALELGDGSDEDLVAEATNLFQALQAELAELETQSLLSEELDVNDAILTINAGAGGTESCDWAQMLLRMYRRYGERKGWEVEILDILEGEEAGIKNVSMEIRGPFAFGLLKAESGVHRLVRISPFDSNARRHTSFASVFVTPVVSDDIKIEVNPADLKIDTYRASGAGGQHVNKTDSAVRITHVPTGIIVACQTQRSQHQNRDKALQMLKSALYEREMEQRRKAQKEMEANKSDISWGSQIRSYVLHPYKLVKDHRTDHETSGADEVLDGSIESFIKSFLGKNLTSSAQPS